MATMTNVFLANFLPFPFATEALRWSNLGGSFVIESSGSHNGERVLNAPLASARSFAPSTYALASMEARGLNGSGAFHNILFKFRNAATGSLANLECDTAGNLYWLSGGINVATTTIPITSAAAFFTLEAAWANTNPHSSEVRLNGQRIQALTTTDFAATSATSFAAAQPVGLMTRATPNIAGATVVDIELGDSGGTNGTAVYWYRQANGSSLWTSVKTGTSFATASDFPGPNSRIWGYYNSLTGVFYPMGPNWQAAAGAFPASVADQPGGTDGDTTRISNAVNGTGVAADKVSAFITQLPGTATNLNALQVTTVARLSGGTSKIRTGFRSAGADTMAAADFTLGASYAVNDEGFAQLPYSFGGTQALTVGAWNAIEHILEQRALT